MQRTRSLDLGSSSSMSAAQDSSSSSWVPVRALLLTNLSRDLGTALQSRWWHDHHEERRWVNAAAAAGAGPGPWQQLALARDLCDVLSASGYSLSCMVRGLEEALDEALDPGSRPRPDSAAWWRYRYVGCSGLRHGFVHLSPAHAARARDLLADASARARRVRALREDLARRCWPWPAAAAADDGGGAAQDVLSTPSLLGRLRRAQRLADAVLVPLRALKRLLDRLAGAATRSVTRRAASVP